MKLLTTIPLCWGLTCAAIAQSNPPPLHLLRTLPATKPTHYPDSILSHPLRVQYFTKEATRRIDQQTQQYKDSSFAEMLKASPLSPETAADQIVAQTTKQSTDLISTTTGLELPTDPDKLSLDRGIEQLSPAQDSIASWASRKGLVSDSTRQRAEGLVTRGKELTDEQNLQKRYEQSNPFAVPGNSGEELEALSTTPLPLLRGEVMSDSSVTTLRDKVQGSPTRTEAIVKRIEEGTDYQKLLIKKRPSLLDRSYGEATIGLAPRASEMIQVVPIVGTYLTRHVSLGVGVDGLLQGFRDSRAIVGLKTLAKVDVLPRRFYLQVENTSYFSDLSYFYEEVEAQRENVQVPYVGAGVLLDVFDTKSINVSLMHRLGEHPFFDEGTASWVVRFGMSFFRQPKL